MTKLWLKRAMLLAVGTAFSWPLNPGCLTAAVQRILVAVNFD